MENKIQSNSVFVLSKKSRDGFRGKEMDDFIRLQCEIDGLCVCVDKFNKKRGLHAFASGLQRENERVIERERQRGRGTRLIRGNSFLFFGVGSSGRSLTLCVCCLYSSTKGFCS